jgi:fructose-1,6-bisphosphatase/inositol monophosphatase family enzyme
MGINQAQITQILSDAGAILKARFFQPVSYQEKARYDLVTEVDRELEDYLIKNLEMVTPGVSFLSEECGEIKKESPVRWIIDPLDGTANFIFGVPYFCLSLGLEMEGKLTQAYVYNPITEELYSSNEADGKSYLNGQLITVSQTSLLKEALVVFGFSANRKGIDKYYHNWNQLFEGSRKGLGLLSPALNICNVARGRIDCFIDHGSNPEGHAAAALILKNAGGRVLNYDLSRWDPMSKGIFAANGSRVFIESTSS